MKKNLNNKEQNITTSYFEHENKVLNSSIDIANGFNDYFVNIPRKLLTKITESGSLYDFDLETS